LLMAHSLRGQRRARARRGLQRLGAGDGPQHGGTEGGGGGGSCLAGDFDVAQLAEVEVELLLQLRARGGACELGGERGRMQVAMIYSGPYMLFWRS
jgi:hypothetical protein